MRKTIISILGIMLLIISQQVSAQIVGKDDRPVPVRKDTIRRIDTIRPKFPSDTAVRKHPKDSLSWTRKVDSTAKVIEHKTAKTGANVIARVQDRSLKNVKGPKGETVYVDKYDRRYYINQDGKRVYIKKPKTE